MYCAACDLRSYPRISPSMIVLITRGDEVLLARSPRFVPGVYSTLAGFAEPGESAEDCLIREVREVDHFDIKEARKRLAMLSPVDILRVLSLKLGNPRN